MGTMFFCTHNDLEEEAINKFFRDLYIQEIEIEIVYEQFLNCVDKNKMLIKIEFDQFVDTFLKKSHSFYLAHLTYFNVLYSIDSNKIVNTRKLGVFLLLLSKGTTKTKVNLLLKHVMTFYDIQGDGIMELIVDIIELNTKDCLFAFREYMDNESFQMFCYRVFIRKRKKLLINHLLENYLSTLYKHQFLISNNDLVIRKDFSRNKIKAKTYSLNSKDIERGIGSLPKDRNQFDLYNLNNGNYSETEKSLLVTSKAIVIESLTGDYIREYLMLTFSQFQGEYIRNWLFEEFNKEREHLC